MAAGNIALVTEEDFTGPCSASGRIVAVDLTDSRGGEPAVNSTPAQPYRMKALSAFHPTQDAGGTVSPSGSCSAHYFEVAGSTIAAGWYGQGVRLIDASNARDLRQVGYFYVTGTDPATNPSSLVWDTAWHGDLLYVFDMARGIEILRLKSGPFASATLPTVRSPAMRRDPLAAKPVASLDARGLVCPLFDIPTDVAPRGPGAARRPPASLCASALADLLLVGHVAGGVFEDVGMGSVEHGQILGGAVQIDAAEVVAVLGDDVAPAGAQPLGVGLDVRGDLGGSCVVRARRGAR